MLSNKNICDEISFSCFLAFINNNKSFYFYHIKSSFNHAKKNVYSYKKFIFQKLVHVIYVNKDKNTKLAVRNL